MGQAETLTFGELLRQWRTEHGWTQEHLGEVAGLSVEAIGTLERSVNRRPRKATLQLLIRALDLSEGDRLLFEASAHRTIRPRAGGHDTKLDLPADAELRIHTFMMAQTRGSAQRHVDPKAAEVSHVAAQFALHMKNATAAHGGRLIEQRDDQALSIFSSPRQALSAAAELQARFAHALVAAGSFQPGIALAVVTGAASRDNEGYHGAALTLATRLCCLAGPGEILTNESVVQPAHMQDGLQSVYRGSTQLQGFSGPVQVTEVRRIDPSPIPTSEHGWTDLGNQRRPSPRLPIGNFLGALPDGQIVGRTRELQQLMVALDGVARGAGNLILLGGEAGVGKTRLAQEASLHLRNAGFLVVAGRCYEPHASSAFYPFVDALAAALAVAPPSLTREVGRRWPYLGRLLPDYVESSPVLSTWPDNQQRLFHAVSGFVQALADVSPVAVLLDDLHWADESSLALLRHLAREARSHRVFLLATYRDTELRTRPLIEGTLRDLEREGLDTRIDIQRLDVTGTADLVGSIMDAPRVSDELAQLVHHRTEGNPYFVVQILRALVEQGDIVRTETTWNRKAIEAMQVPDSVRTVVDQRVARLSVGTQAILREASVLGQSFHLDDLDMLTNDAGASIEMVLQEATAVGLVRTTRQGNASFDHALTQQVLYAELMPQRRRTLHLGVAEALEQRSREERETRVGELAWHFLQANDLPRALHYAMVVGARAEAVFAHAEAERHYGQALRLSRELDDGPAEAASLGKLGEVLHASGRYDEALQTLEEAAEMYHAADDFEAESRIVAQIGHSHFERGTSEEGISRLQNVLALRSVSQPSPGLAAMYGSLARLFLDVERLEEELEVAEKAVDVAQATGDERSWFGAEATCGDVLTMLGRPDEGLRRLDAVIPLAEAAGDVDNLSRILNNAGDACFSLGDLKKCEQYFQRALEVAEQRDDPDAIVGALVALSEAAYFIGEWERASAHLVRADVLRPSIGTSRNVTGFLFTRLRLCLAKGDMQAVTQDVEAYTSAAGRTRSWGMWGSAYSVLAERDMLLGEPDSAVARLEPLLDRTHASQRLDLPTLAWAYLEQGNLERAQRTIASALTQATDWHHRPRLAETLRVHGMVQSRQRKWDEASHTFEEALSMARSMTMPYLEARVLYEYGRMDAATDNHRQGREHLAEALVIFQRLGACLYMDWTESALRSPRINSRTSQHFV